MIIQLYDGFLEIERFTGVRRVEEGMKRIASYMAKHNLRDCNAYQLVKGEMTGRGWRIFKSMDTFFYRVNESMKRPVNLGKTEDFL